MRFLGRVLFWWATGSTALAIVIGRVLRAMPPAPPPLPADWLADQPVDVWSDVRIDAEFAAIVWPYEVQS